MNSKRNNTKLLYFVTVIWNTSHVPLYLVHHYTVFNKYNFHAYIEVINFIVSFDVLLDFLNKI